MKQIIAVIAAFMICNSGFSQKIVKKDGQYLVEATNTASRVARDSSTKYKFRDTKGQVYDVYVSARGKYYYNKISGTTGKPYKVYLKME